MNLFSIHGIRLKKIESKICQSFFCPLFLFFFFSFSLDVFASDIKSKICDETAVSQEKIQRISELGNVFHRSINRNCKEYINENAYAICNEKEVSCANNEHDANCLSGGDMSVIISGIVNCLEDAAKKEKRKSDCVGSCYAYVTTTFFRCKDGDLRGYGERECNKACQADSVLEKMENDVVNTNVNTNFLRAVENQIARGDCFEVSRKKFVTEFTQKCMQKLKDIQGSKILLCQDGASKDNPGCDQYCEKQAEKLHGDPITSSSVVNTYKQRMLNCMYDDAEPRCRQLAPPVNYRALTGGGSRGLVDTQVGKLLSGNSKVAHIDRSQEITDEGERAKLSWFNCDLRLNNGGKVMKCELDLEQALNSAGEKCTDLEKRASDCCHEPESCIGGGLASALDGLSKVYVDVSSMQGQKKHCESLKNVHGMYAGAQGTMAAQCKTKASSCKRECSSELGNVKLAFKEACGEGVSLESEKVSSQSFAGEGGGSMSCSDDFYKAYYEKYRSMEVEGRGRVNISSIPERCERLGMESNRRIGDMATNMGASIMAGMNECADQAREQGWVFNPSPLPTTTDGSSSTVGRTTGTVPPPVVPPPTTGGGGRTTAGTTTGPGFPQMAETGTKKNIDALDIDGLDLAEGNRIGEGGIKQGMGGLIGGGATIGGGGGFGGVPAGGGGGDDPGYSGDAGKKDKILMGMRGGKYRGYGTGAGFSGDNERGGNRGYGRRGKKDKRKLATLDLNKLRKGKSLNRKVGRYGSPYESIFDRMSARYKILCIEDRMQQCDKHQIKR